ncbi:MAG TPA: DEAD/DEAH box helicase [Candidatus Saccharimonadales bacterium]
MQAAIQRLEKYLEASRDSFDKRVLKDRQVGVMEDLYTFLATHTEELHGYISLPTGVGKTVLFTELIKATGLKTLVLTPTRLLLSHTEATLDRFSDDEIIVGKVFSGEKNGDELITLSTYASFVRHTKDPHSLYIKPGQYDLIILDEAHKALASKTRKALANYKNAIQIGFTATEDYSDRHRLYNLLPYEIHKMSIPEAVESNLIVPFSNVVVETGIDVYDVSITTSNEYDVAELEHALNTEARNEIALKVYLQYFQGQKVIIFCNGIEHAKAVASLFAQEGISAAAVYGSMPDDMQDISEAFGSQGAHALEVLCNDKLLAEGFDAPQAAVCFNLVPTLSRVRAQQRGGRVLRLDPNNPYKHAYVVDFIDKNYQKPPVLFSDPKVAEQAQIGDGAHSIFANRDTLALTDNARLITDPSIVTAMAYDFAERRKAKRYLPPEGWLSIGQVCALYQLNKGPARKELSALTDQYPEEFGEFHNPKTNSRSLHYYFGEKIMRGFAASRGEPYIDFEHVFPEGWITHEELASQYPPKVLKSIFYRARLLHPGTFSDYSITSNGIEYFGPIAQKILHKVSKPDETWKPAEGLCIEFDKDEDKIEEICYTISKRDNLLGSNRPYWFLVEDKEVLYLSPIMYEALRDELKTINKSRPLVLRDGEVVELRRRASDAQIDLLIRAFAKERRVRSSNSSKLWPNNISARKLDKSRNELEEIYNAFRQP